MNLKQELIKLASENCIEMGFIVYIALVVTLIAMRQKAQK